MSSDTKGIFISYRRAKDAGHAGRLGDVLSEHFGSHKVFYDVDSIEPGLDFVEAIERALDSSEVMLAIIGESWLTVTDVRGQPRLENPHDLVRVEIATALERNVRVIPVLVQEAYMPRADELPQDLAALARRNAVELRDTRWKADVGSLIEILDKVVGSKEAEPQRSQHYSPPVKDTERPHKPPIATKKEPPRTSKDGGDHTPPPERQKDESARQDGGDHSPQDRGDQIKVLGAIGAALAGVMWLISLVTVTSETGWYTPVLLLAQIATLAALIGIYRYVRQQPGYSTLTTVAFSLVATSSAISTADIFFRLITDSWLIINQLAPAGWEMELLLIMAFLAPGIGYVLLGIISLRARFLPGWGNVAWFIGGVGALGIFIQYIITVDFDFGFLKTTFIAYGLMWLALGYALWANGSVRAEKN